MAAAERTATNNRRWRTGLGCNDVSGSDVCHLAHAIRRVVVVVVVVVVANVLLLLLPTYDNDSAQCEPTGFIRSKTLQMSVVPKNTDKLEVQTQELQYKILGRDTQQTCENETYKKAASGELLVSHCFQRVKRGRNATKALLPFDLATETAMIKP